MKNREQLISSLTACLETSQKFERRPAADAVYNLMRETLEHLQKLPPEDAYVPTVVEYSHPLGRRQQLVVRDCAFYADKTVDAVLLRHVETRAIIGVEWDAPRQE